MDKPQPECLLSEFISKLTNEEQNEEFSSYNNCIAGILEDYIYKNPDESIALRGIQKLFTKEELDEKEKDILYQYMSNLNSKLESKNLTTSINMLTRKIGGLRPGQTQVQNPLKMRGPSCMGPLHVRHSKRNEKNQ